MQKFYLRILPYVISLVVGAIIFAFVEYIEDANWQNLVLNISAGLISVPFVFICYEFIKNISEGKIRNKVRDYVKFHSEKMFFSFLKYIYTWFYPTEKTSIVLDRAKVQRLLDLEVQDIEKMLTEKALLGFFIYKDMASVITNLSDILKDKNINEYVNDSEMIHFMDIFRNSTLIVRETVDFIMVGKNESLNVEREDNPHNPMYVLYFDKIRIDSGDFVDDETSKLLLYFKVPTELIELLSHQIYDLLDDINDLTKIMGIDYWNEDYPYGIKSPNQ